MLRFLNVTLENFGPYKGKQIVDLTRHDGVSFFWGNNGRGKTTLLNAFRYALFGIVQRRTGVLHHISEMENTESREEGDYGFSVELKMDNDGTVYDLNRSYKPRSEVRIPSRDDDYENSVVLRKNGSVLGSSESTHELKNILPEEVSRFFLFDGELLKEYEELLEDDTTIGEGIKESIEKILGVPVLTNGKTDIDSCRSRYFAEKTKAAAKDGKTKGLASQLSALEESIKQRTQIIKDLRSQLEGEIARKHDIENRMSETEQVRDWMSKRDAYADSLQDRELDKKTAEDNCKKIVAENWKGMLRDIITKVLNNLSSQISKLEEKKNTNLVAERFLEEIRTAYSEHHCPICSQDIPDDILLILRNRIRTAESEFSGLSDQEEEMLLDFRQQHATAKKLMFADCKDALANEERNLETAIVHIGDLKQKISDLDQKIIQFGDTTGLAKLGSELATVSGIIGEKNQAIKKETTELEREKSSRAQISLAIDKAGNEHDLLVASKKLTLCQSILDIFSEGLDAYREKLKHKVEKDASDIFRRISSDPDYNHLRINDNYGLTIIHKNGTAIPGRSSGFEHIVALSLIGALHKNAPLQGPIIIDSPFGRLDSIHKERLVRALPEMAKQAIVLAYIDEIDSSVVHDNLGTNLIKEFHLDRISAFYTTIR